MEPEKAMLIVVSVPGDQVTPEERLEELEQLALTAGAVVVGSLTQNRVAVDPVTVLGRGKIQQVRELAADKADLLVFDHDLSPGQQRSIEELAGVRTIDRTQLILDIFASRALSREGQLQVRLAQLRYLLPRLHGRGQQLSRLGGGIGTRGPGETKLETDRRRIRTRIRQLEREINDLRRHRQLRRDGRRARGLATVGLVGYTNAGKSTLMNALTAGGALVEDKLFATLDPLVRAARTPAGREFLLSDTVGFISRLPTHLVAAFRATLEEVTAAELLVHVVDSSSPRAAWQRSEVELVLAGLGVTAPVIVAHNKVDLLPSPPLAAIEGEVHVSAATGYGLDRLLKTIELALGERDGLRQVRLLLPHDRPELMAFLYREGRVLSSQYGDEGITVDAILNSRTRAHLSRELAGGEADDNP